MKTQHTIFSLFVSALLVSASSVAQEADSLSSNSARLHIQSNVDSALVYLDTTLVGVTPLLLNDVRPGAYRVKVVHPQSASWLTENISDSIDVLGGTTQELTYTFQKNLFIITSPSGAGIFSGDSLLGTTPLVLKTDASSLRLHLEGFEENTIETASANRGIISTSLKRIWQIGAEESTDYDPQKRSTSSSLRLYITGATTVLAGATAAYFKVKADNTYSRYEQTGDTGTLSEVNRLDTSAGVALVATQISLGLFTYFILQNEF